jgi:hypothetical protein
MKTKLSQTRSIITAEEIERENLRVVVLGKPDPVVYLRGIIKAPKPE